MSWVKVDDGFPEHQKVVGLTDRSFRLHVAALCHCGRNLTDGALTPRAVKVLCALTASSTKRHVAELVGAALWLERDDGYEVKDFLVYNRSGEQVKEDREKARVRMEQRRSLERVPERSGEQTSDVRLPSTDPVVLPEGLKDTDQSFRDFPEIQKRLGTDRYFAFQRLLVTVNGADNGTPGVLASLCKKIPASKIDDVSRAYPRGAPAGAVVNALKQKRREYEVEVKVA